MKYGRFYKCLIHNNTIKHTDFTSYAHGHDDLVEFAQPDLPVYLPEPHIPYLPPIDVTFESHYPAQHYGPPHLLDNRDTHSHSHKHFSNYISTDRKGKFISE